MTPTGWLVVRDALTIGDWHASERAGRAHAPADRPRRRAPAGAHGRVRAGRGAGRADLRAALQLRPRRRRRWTPVRRRARLRARRQRRRRRRCGCYSDMRMGIEGHTAHARHTMREGERRFCALSWTRSARRAADRRARRTRTSRGPATTGASGWPPARYPDHPWRGYLQRSALVLKGLTYAPTGAMIAALTTSLPETPGGERNWDYRYCWMRDATFTLWGLHALDLDWEANDFMEYLADLDAQQGRHRCRSCTASAASGTCARRRSATSRATSGRARCARATAPTASARTTSTARCSTPSTCTPSATTTSTTACGRCSRDQVAGAWRVWRKPDQGIWEARGEPRHYVSSKLMCWVALDRGARLAELRGEPELAERWQAGADEIRADILDHGVDERGVFVQHYDTTALDASNLLVPIVRFLPRRRRARARDGARDLRRAERPRADPALPRRGDRRRPARRGGHVPDLLVLDGLGALGDRRDASVRARCASGCSRSPRRSRSTPRSSTRAAAAISATSRRRSRTSR